MSATNPPQPNPSNTQPDDYELRLDEQVSHFLGLNHNLTFFVITAAVGTLGFTINFLISNNLLISSNKTHLSLVISVSASALLSAGLALYALRLDITSFRLHLRYRHEKKSYSQFSNKEKKYWDRTNSKAEWSRKASSGLLVFTVALQLFILIFLFAQKGDTSMHHFGEDSTEVKASESSYDIEFTNKETGQKITMHIPRVGVKEKPGESPTIQEVQDLANEVAHVLRDKLR